jgi:tetratricopeptide (TPR) repeat protein
MWRTIKAYLLYTWGGLHRYFGNQNSLTREHRRAVYYFTRAYETNPAMEQALLARAILLGREMEEPEAALADFDELLQKNPDNALALFNRALIYQQRGNYPEALADINAYLRLPANDPYRETARHMQHLLVGLLDENTQSD